MVYSHKFDIASKKYIKYCKELIVENFERMFDMWLSIEADMEFGHGYQTIFKEQFGDYITTDVEQQLFFAGKNIIYAINTFIRIKKDKYKLSELLKFVEEFVSEQLNDFDNDYDTTGWYNEEIQQTEEIYQTEENPTN